MTDPTLQSRLDDALRDCDEQRAELVRLRERVEHLETERAKLRKALGKMSDAAMTNGWMERPTVAELAALGAFASITADDMRRERAERTENVPARVTDWPEYRAESDPK